MVDPVGTKAVFPVDRGVKPVARVSAAAAAPAAANGDADTARLSSVGKLAAQAAASPPVDHDRVAEIRRAIANHTFPILPGKIADSLIALQNNWNPNDPA